MANKKFKIFQDASFTALAAFGGILLGLVKNAMIAARYGTGMVYDAFLIASNLPFMITGFALNGASNLVPIFSSELKSKSEEEAWDIGSRLLSFWIVLIVSFTVIFVFLVPLLVKMLAPGFGEEQILLTRHISYIILWSAIFSGLASLSNLLSYTYHEFGLPAVSGIVNNILIVITLWMIPSQSVDVLAYAFVLGAAGQLLIQYKALGKMVRFFRFRFNWRHPVVRQVVRLSIPQYIGQGGVVLNTAIDRGFASMLPAGAVSAISYSLMIVEIPVTVFINAITRVYFPHFSRNANDPDLFRKDVQTSVRMTTLIIFPVSIGFIALGHPLITLLFERGAFTKESTLLTVSALSFLSLGLLGEGLNSLYVNAYFAKQDTVIPMASGLLRVAVILILNFFLVRLWGIAGLAISTSIATYSKFGILAYFGRRRIGLGSVDVLKGNFLKIGAASLIMGGIVYFLSVWFSQFLVGTELRNKILLVVSCITAGVIVYSGLLFLMGVKELSTAHSMIVRKINFRRLGGKTG